MFKQLIHSQKEFFATGESRKYQYRKDALLKLKNAIQVHEEEILDALHKDLNKHHFEGYMSEVMQVLHELDHTLKLLKSYTNPQKVKTPMTHFMGKSYIKHEPYGVSLIISPWNYPFALCLIPLIGSIAAGNCAILKPSNYAHHTQQIIQKIIQGIFPSCYIDVLIGDSSVVQPLIEERPDFVFFTGSVPVGKIIASHCAKHLIPSTLELGGKNPCIIDESANLKIAVKRIAWGKFLNAGQTCIAPDFLLIHHSIKDQFLSLLLDEIKHFFGDQPIQNIGKTISSRHYERMIKLLDFDCNLGQIYGGNKDEEKLEPTVIDFGKLTSDNPALSLPIMQEEIFAPILPILSFENLQECIDFTKKFEKSLALYIFSQNKHNQEQILDSVSFGGGCINDCIMHIVNPHLPFGGVGHSGIGCYHGKFSIETFSHKKAIYSAPDYEIPLRYPPYDKPMFGFLSKMKFIKSFLS
ncbi:aldehyde dehydrogenase family protein [Helicobacter pametensis]|uniref:aldehyde dehydrogenase family protein n=1 Tax=Helicobacter pametensis TaxID=95149 RepID=UPI0004BB5729|nr:aldehyde dehydrogenase family protein [Helicobacter pametensis]